MHSCSKEISCPRQKCTPVVKNSLAEDRNQDLDQRILDSNKCPIETPQDGVALISKRISGSPWKAPRIDPSHPKLGILWAGPRDYWIGHDRTRRSGPGPPCTFLPQRKQTRNCHIYILKSIYTHIYIYMSI